MTTHTNTTFSFKESCHNLPHQILTGTTWHVRHIPSKHRFNYPYRYWGLSLNRLAESDFPEELELDTLLTSESKLSRYLNTFKIFSTQAQSFKSLHSFDFSDYCKLDSLDDSNLENADYLYDYPKTQSTISHIKSLSKDLPTNNIKAAKLWRNNILQQFKRLTNSQPTGDILALVVGRNLGVYFSPVNFYLGFDDIGDISHLLAEVSNTPWNKRHFYGFKLTGNNTEFSHNKGFHVSPFNPINQQYTWNVNVKNTGLKSVNISIGVSDSRGKVFEAGINMLAQAMTKENVAISIKDSPLMNYSSLGRIYWHAFILYVIKNVPYVGYNQSLDGRNQTDAKHSRVQSTESGSKKDNTNIDISTAINTNTKTFYQQHSKQGRDHIMSPQNKYPTDRVAQYPTEKLIPSFVKQVANSTALAPIKFGIDMASRRVLFKALSYLQHGSITIIENNGSDGVSNSIKDNGFNRYADKFIRRRQKNKVFTFSNTPKDLHHRLNGDGAVGDPLHATVNVHNKDFYRKLILGGDIALADSYINGDWDVDDLTALIRIGARNRQIDKQLEGMLTKLSKVFEFRKHQSRTNTVRNSKSNILAHYDLGNEMYKTFLDDSMMYSSGIYSSPESSLFDAQQTKLKTLCELLELNPEDHVIEIGTGWGGFAIFAVQNYGCHVTTTTISDAQYIEAKRRVEEAKLSDKITLLKQDYRKLSGKYDKLISIEMVEAVGHEYLPTFFAKCDSLLKSNGIMALQAITFKDQGYADYLNSVDFIQSHIFPGGCLLSNQEIITQFTNQTDMVVKSLTDYGYDYARTLKDWRQAFIAHLDDIRAMGYDEAFIRLWQFYFCYCEAGFLERTVGVVQIKAVKPDYR